jgi:hypothetical protein
MLSNLVRVQLVVFVCDVLQSWSAHMMKTNWEEDAIYEIEQ